jgi:hypothetical protein
MNAAGTEIDMADVISFTLGIVLCAIWWWYFNMKA